jgi:hypothetical protein
VHEVAFVVLQLRVAALPETTEAGFAVNETVGAGATTVTAAVCDAVPPALVQVKEKSLVAFSVPVETEPESGFAPLQAPDAVQAVAFEVLQESVELPPVAMLDGFTENCSVGAGGGAACVDTRIAF